MMRTRTIATGAGITGSADCPQAFRRRVVSSAGPLALCGLLPRRRSTIPPYCNIQDPRARRRRPLLVAFRFGNGRARNLTSYTAPLASKSSYSHRLLQKY